MEISSDEMSLLQLYRTAKKQLGGMLPNLANLTLMSITPQNGMVAITQSTELFAQVPVDNEQIVSNPAPRTLPRNPTPQKQREHHLSSSSDSSSSSSETDEEPPPKRPQKKWDGKNERSSAAKELARPPANDWHNHLVPLNKLASLSTSQISKLDDVNEVDDQIRDLTPETGRFGKDSFFATVRPSVHTSDFPHISYEMFRQMFLA